MERDLFLIFLPITLIRFILKGFFKYILWNILKAIVWTLNQLCLLFFSLASLKSA